MNKLRVASNALALTSAVSFGSLIERVADPFDRHEKQYTVEGPQGHSEVFYLSVNHYDAEGKHDDRTGDLLLACGALSVAGSIALRLRTEPEEVQSSQMTTLTH